MGNGEWGTGNREQGTRNREQGTGNREQGTGNRNSRFRRRGADAAPARVRNSAPHPALRATFPSRQLRKTLFSQALSRKETLFYRVFRSNVCGKVRFFEIPSRGRLLEALSFAFPFRGRRQPEGLTEEVVTLISHFPFPIPNLKNLLALRLHHERTEPLPQHLIGAGGEHEGVGVDGEHDTAEDHGLEAVDHAQQHALLGLLIHAHGA